MTHEPEDFERWLGAVKDARPPRAPLGFTDRVLARIALDTSASAAASASAANARAWMRTLPASVGADPLPWWTRVFAQPVCALGFVVVGVAFLLRAQLVDAPRVAYGLLVQALALLAPWWALVAAPFARFGATPFGELMLALALLPVVALLAYVCYAATAWLAHPGRSLASSKARRTGP